MSEPFLHAAMFTVDDLGLIAQHAEFNEKLLALVKISKTFDAEKSMLVQVTRLLVIVDFYRTVIFTPKHFLISQHSKRSVKIYSRVGAERSTRSLDVFVW